MNARFQPHDLLRIDASSAGRHLVPESPLDWPAIKECLSVAPLVVMRHALWKHGMVPVGLRGEQRSQRYAAWLEPQGICKVFTPESLRTSNSTRDLPAFIALLQLERRWRDLQQPWGPTGSTGFELASGAPMVKATSDLDILVRARKRLSEKELRHIADQCSGLPCAVDVQVETLHGAFALREYLDTQGRLLLRTYTGPMLVYDPWRLPELWRTPA